jgi:hypothetical protein
MVGGRKVEAWSREGGVREWTRRATVGLQRGARIPEMRVEGVAAAFCRSLCSEQ